MNQEMTHHEYYEAMHRCNNASSERGRALKAVADAMEAETDSLSYESGADYIVGKALMGIADRLRKAAKEG